MRQNFIYSKLVHDDADIIGMVAYSIYKKHKIEFIESVKSLYGREPNEEEWEAFWVSSNTDSQLSKYVSHADSIIASFVLTTAGEQIKDAERKMLEEYRENIKAVLPSNWKTIGLSVLGSFIFSAVVTLALILGAFSEKDKANMVEKYVKEPVNTEVPASVSLDSVSKVPSERSL